MKKVVINYKDLTKKEKVFYWIRKIATGILYVAILVSLTIASIYSLMHNSSDSESSVISASAEISNSDSSASFSSVTLNTSIGSYDIGGIFSIYDYSVNNGENTNSWSITFEMLVYNVDSDLLTYFSSYPDSAFDYSVWFMNSSVVDSNGVYHFIITSPTIYISGYDSSTATSYGPDMCYLCYIPYTSEELALSEYGDIDTYLSSGGETIFDFMSTSYKVENDELYLYLTIDVDSSASLEYNVTSYVTAEISGNSYIYNPGTYGYYRTLVGYYSSSSVVFDIYPYYMLSCSFGFRVSDTYSEIYDSAYSAGYSDGYDAGFEAGSTYDMDLYQDIYDIGYSDGYLAGSGSSWSDPVVVLLGGVANIFSINIFGYFSLGTIFQICLYIFVVMMFIKMFSG